MSASKVAVITGFVVGWVVVAVPAKAAPENPPSADRAPAASTATVEKLFNDWMFRCAGGVCQVFLTLADEKTKEAKLSWSFVYDPKTEKLSTIVQLPLMAALPPGVRITLNQSVHYTWPFQYCDSTGCRAVAVLTDQVFDSIKEQKNVAVQYIPYGQQNAQSFNVPVSGLGAATAELIATLKR
jgi:invasion protein IalB